jgi:hypothetical protein
MNHVSSYPRYPLFRRESSVDLKLKNGQSDGKLITASKSDPLYHAFEDPATSAFVGGVAEACDQRGLGLLLLQGEEPRCALDSQWPSMVLSSIRRVICPLRDAVWPAPFLRIVYKTQVETLS